MKKQIWEVETEDEEIAVMQRMINDGSVWKMEGSMGRRAMDLLRNRQCELGPKPTVDYWGNRIPSRYEVKAGTTGSPLKGGR